MSSPLGDEPLRLPVAPAPPPTPAFPFVSAITPVVGAAVMWMATGSSLMLWFALLGPLLAGASLIDGRRTARKTRRRATRDLQVQISRLRQSISARHDRERYARWMRHPDVITHLRHPDQTWRTVPGRAETLVVGRGVGASEVVVQGGDETPATEALRREAREISDVPVLVPRECGVAVVGPRRLADAVVRALILQLCINSAPGQVQVAGSPEAWVARLPHAREPSGPVVGVLGHHSSAHTVADIAFAVVPEGAPPPPRCAAVLTLLSPHRARLTHGEASCELQVEAISMPLAEKVAAQLARRADATEEGVRAAPVPPLRALLPPPGGAGSAGLRAVIGVSGDTPASVDLVAEGPHAVVIGVTGSGKSELLTTWVASLAATRSPREVSFLLVDFKGGRTFDTLLQLPHVTGVLTDLDESAALRAIESLRAEVRHRERALAAAGAREISEAGDALARLVVVVDEYAALVAAFPTLHDLFADLAARGRALGIHLILASQRAAGVFRDAVLANAPLRLALRVTDPADSRAVLGVDDAATLSGRSADVGLCLVRGGADAAPWAVRVARCTSEEVRDLAIPGPPARRPWLPPLPDRIPLESIARPPGALAIGMVDQPDQQRQSLLTLADDEPGLVVIGAAGSGKSACLRALAHQARALVVIDTDPERGWDDVAVAEAAAPGTLVIADDLDLLLTRLPADHAAALRERLERLAREARSRRIRLIVSAQRLSGAISRIADAIPRRLLLAHASRSDYVAAGGAAADFAQLPPGRGHLAGAVVQTLWTATDPPLRPHPPAAPWFPARAPVALIAPAGPRTRAVLQAWSERGAEIVAVDAPEAMLRTGHVVWGTPDAWLSQWRLLSAARSEAALIIDAGCATEFRSLTGDRALPPYARPLEGRAWSWSPSGATRILLPG